MKEPVKMKYFEKLRVIEQLHQKIDDITVAEFRCAVSRIVLDKGFRMCRIKEIEKAYWKGYSIQQAAEMEIKWLEWLLENYP